MSDPATPASWSRLKLCGWAGFIVLASLSFINPTLSTAALVAGCLLAMARWPNLALGIAAFALGFKQVFALDPEHSRIVMVAALGGVAVQAASDRRTLGLILIIRRRPLLMLLGLSLLLDAAHVATHWDQDGLQRLGWHALAMLAALRAAVLADDARATDALKHSIVAAGIVGAVISAAYLYLPWPQLIGNRFIHTEILRLAGVQDEANSMARWILPAAIAAVIADHRRGSLWSWLLVSVGTIALCATASKSGLISFGAACLLFAAVSGKWRAAGAALVAAAIGATLWYGALEAPLKHHAAAAWQAAHLTADPAVADTYRLYVPAGSNQGRPLGQTFSSLRIQTEAPAQATAHHAPTPLLDTGSRYLLWKTGLQVALAHPWWGIGAAGWPAEMQGRLGLPYLSPHNGLLHVAGSFGVLGALLYLAVLARLALLARRRLGDMWALCVVAGYFTFEVFDVSSILTPALITPMIWMLMGQLEGRVDLLQPRMRIS